MSENSHTEHTADLTRWLDELRAGDESARQKLLQSAQARLTKLARKMLADFPGVRRWEETDDVFQNAVIRLCRSLDHVVPVSTTALMRLAARDIRCALIDLARHYGGPEGIGRHERSFGDPCQSTPAAEPFTDTHEPSCLAYWSEFHQRVQELPDDLQEIMDLLWYRGLTQADAAACLQISERTVQRRWRDACLSLHDALKGLPPGIS